MKPYAEGDGFTLYAGDALAVLRELPTASVDAVVTDPPYSSGGMVRGDRAGQGTVAKYVTTQNTRTDELENFSGDNRDQRSFGYWTALWLSEALRVTKPGGIVIAFTDWRQLPTVTDSIQAGGWVWRGVVPWHKPLSRPQAGRFTNECEYVVWGSSGPMPTDYTLPVLPGFYSVSPPRSQTREHITQKPVQLMRELVKIVPPGGVVLDPFMGAGTTGAASVIEGRGFIGSEIRPHFQRVSALRIGRAASNYVAPDEQGGLFDVDA